MFYVMVGSATADTTSSTAQAASQDRGLAGRFIGIRWSEIRYEFSVATPG